MSICLYATYGRPREWGYIFSKICETDMSVPLFAAGWNGPECSHFVFSQFLFDAKTL